MTAIDLIKPFAEDKEDVHVLIDRPGVTKGAAARQTPEKRAALRGYSAYDTFTSFASGGCGCLARNFYVLDAS